MSIKQLDTNKEKAFLDIELNTLIVNGSSSHQDLVVTGNLTVTDEMAIGSTTPFNDYIEETIANVEFDADLRVFPTSYLRDVQYLRISNLVTLILPTIYELTKGMDVENYFLMDELIPEHFRPSQEKLINCNSLDNALPVIGAVEIFPSGELRIYRSYDLQLNYTGSAQGGVERIAISYHI